MAEAASLTIALRFLSLVAEPGDVFELRGLARVHGQQHVTSGFFDDPTALARAAVDRSGKDDGVYFTINPGKPELLFRAPKNALRRAGSGDTTSDRDVARRRLLLVDVDPIRPAGISSSDAEHAAAIDLARRIRDELAAAGWPAPIVADSGNGAHLLYRIDLPTNDEGLVARVLGALSKRYSTTALKIDEKVFNAARISKVYGTVTRKGVDAPERPHRLARMIDEPETFVAVSRAQLEAFAPVTAKDTLKRKAETYALERGAFDLVAWIAEHLPGAKERDWNEGRRWILPVCPFNDQHDRGEAFVVQLHSGAVSAGCKHDSCVWGWRDLRVRFEPDAYDRERTNGNGSQRRLSDREPPPEVIYEDASARAEILAIAARDDDPPAIVETPRIWWSGPEIADEVWRHKDDPWVSLKIGEEEIARLRVGGIAVEIGGSGSGKSSLAANFLFQHARDIGPAIALSIELPVDEIGGRIVGMQCDATWEDVLRGQVALEHVRRALSLPRLYVIDRDNATLENLEKCALDAKARFPGEPIMTAIDYAQLLESKEREERQKVAAVFRDIDRVSRRHMLATIAISQMSRESARAARDGDRLGAETADLGAESAAIERYASITLTLGKMGEPCEDRSRTVELSIGKARMVDGGDAVHPMRYWGYSGKWRRDGAPMSAAKVREQRDAEKTKRDRASLENQIVGCATNAKAPLSRNDIVEAVQGRRDAKMRAIAELVQRGDLVEVARRAPRSRSWMLWTPDRARDAGVQLVRDIPTLGVD